ncbi:transglutaminase domain-containing protein [Tenacibaculum halocynthiae]|uniref:transglutaminase domain-containing protein n=1 Tax=Tenacibaculum halocynthiae TaxID=1254437 RepID=UPI003894D635
MRKLFLYLILLISFNVTSQNFKEINEKLKKYPKQITAKRLAKKVAKDFSSKEGQAKAVFYWVSNNIKYNLSAYQNQSQKRIGFSYKNEEDRLQKIQAIKDSIVAKTLKTNKGVCEGYAQTLAKVFSYLGFENEVIKGYVRNSIYDIGEKLNVPNHAWNVVKINNKWVLMDATWASGAVINGRWQPNFNEYFFNFPKKHYLKTHYPKDKKWLFGMKFSKKEFYDQPIYSSDFLKTNLELLGPLKGIIKTKNTVLLKVKNLSSFQTVLCGLSSYRFAKKPSLIYKNDVGYIKITPTKNCNKLFLVVDGKIYIEYKLI